MSEASKYIKKQYTLCLRTLRTIPNVQYTKYLLLKNKINYVLGRHYLIKVINKIKFIYSKILN